MFKFLFFVFFFPVFLRILWCKCYGISKIESFFLFLQKLGGLSYFAGAEKKDERVLVPDLGSLTSIYDRLVLVHFNRILLEIFVGLIPLFLA